MEQYRVDVTLTAEREANEAYLWMAKRSLERANRWFDELLEAIKSLSENPRRYAVAYESDDFPYEVRLLLHGSGRSVCRVLYTIEEFTVIVMHVRHAARAPLTGEEPASNP